MKQTYTKRLPRTIANSLLVLTNMGKLLYKSGKFIKENIPLPLKNFT